jgi:hypothetical protein
MARSKSSMKRTTSRRAALCIALSTFAAVLLSCAARAQCPVYPIALSAQSLATAVPGTILTNIWNGSQAGNFGWLSWTDDPSEPTLANSLTQPGDSYTYINPDDHTDHNLMIGDWVSGKPGVSNGKGVRNALDALIGVQITVPIWDVARGEGKNSAYHIVGYAFVMILDYHLPGQNQISAEFLGYADCGVGGPT